jgi:hypothetical protein
LPLFLVGWLRRPRPSRVLGERKPFGGMAQKAYVNRGVKTMETPFFSASDRQLENLISFDDFEKSLYLNVLFQGGVLIPDNFIFVSSYLDRHINRFHKVSLFEAALENGLIIPSFRNPKRVNFHDVLFELQGAGMPKTAVQGLQRNSTEIASRLQISANKGKSYKYKVWPQFSVGERYQNVILDHLTRKDLIELPENIRFDRNEIRELWKQTATWREDVIQEAINASSRLQVSGPVPGLRRGEIYNAVGRRLKLDIPKQGVDDVCYLLSAVADNEKAYMLLSYFLGWVNECYHLNLAESLESIPNSPKFIPPLGLMYESLLPAGKESSREHKFDVAESVVEFPSLKLLREIEGNDLIEIVNYIGRGYHAAIMDWEANPTALTQQRVSDVMKQYAKELNKYILKKYRYVDTVNLHTFFSNIDERDRITVERVLAPLIKLASSATFGFSDILLEIAVSTFVCYKLDKAEPTSEKIRLISSQKSPEINFPTSKE